MDGWASGSVGGALQFGVGWLQPVAPVQPRDLVSGGEGAARRYRVFYCVIYCAELSGDCKIIYRTFQPIQWDTELAG